MPNSNFGNIQYKASNGLINLDEAQGIVECFVSGIGNKDSVGDICATGAFAKSLQRRKPRVVWGHNWNDPIGKVLEIYEVPASDARLPMKMKMAGIGGLYAKVQFNLQSEKGKEAFANVAFFGEEQEWSIGYKTLRAQYDDNLQANVLYEVELYEVSPVLHGANQLTGTISVKSDEEKMHGMMPMVIGSPAPQGPRRDGIFDEGVSQRISGPQLAGVVAELSRRAAGPVMVVEATENSIVFVKPGKGKFRIGYHFTGSEYMFGKPELIQAEQPKPAVQSGPSPIPGVVAKPSKPSTNNPGMAMPVAMKPVNGGMVMVPLAPVEYEGSDKNKKPELGAEESELAESLVRIASKYGKFDEDGDGIWAGYYPPAENKVKDIGVKCSNCVLYQGEGKCKILDFKVEDEAKCRFAIIPDGVVVGFGKKQYSDILDDEEIKMIEDIEAKYPGEFILGTFRNLVKKRRKKRKSYKTLEEWGTEERELEEKGLDPFLAQDQSYVIPVNLEDAFYFKSVIDPVLEYHRIDTTVNEYGIVINSPLDQESKNAISAATNSAYAILKKKVTSNSIEEKALGRRIAGRAIDRPNIGGKKRRGGRGMGVPSGDLDPRTRRDSNLDGTLFDNVPGWEQPDPTPDGPGSINNPKPSKRQLVDTAKPDGKEKLSSGTRNLRRHADRSEDMEKQFPNAEENQKRIDHEAIAKAWEEQGLGWQEVPRYNSDSNFSSDYLRGREIGVNQSRVMWNGDSVRKRPAKFNEKAKASIEYSDWFSSYIRSVGAYIDAHSKDDSDNWDGIESALKDDVKAKYPDVRERSKEYIANLNQSLNSLGLLDTDKLSSGDKKKPAKEKLASGFTEKYREQNGRDSLAKTDDLVEEYWKIKNRTKTGNAAEERKNTNRLREIRRELESRKPEPAGFNNYKEKPVERISEDRNPKSAARLKFNESFEKPFTPYLGASRISSGKKKPQAPKRTAGKLSSGDSGYTNLQFNREDLGKILDRFRQTPEFDSWMKVQDELEGRMRRFDSPRTRYPDLDKEETRLSKIADAARQQVIEELLAEGEISLQDEVKPKTSSPFGITRDGGRISSGRRKEELLAERLKEIDGLSAEETFITPRRGVRGRGPQPSELQREIYEELGNYANSNDVWDYLNTRYGVEQSDYKYRPGDDGYFSESEPNYNLDDAIKDSMSEEDMRNFLKATAEYEASPDYDEYKKGGPLYDESNKDRKLSSGRAAGRGGFAADSEKQEMDAADESLRNFLNEFDGWDDEEWEFGNQLDSAVERWASANEDMPFINTSVKKMIAEMDEDESIEGQNKLAFLKNLRDSLQDAQYRNYSMRDLERYRDRLERSARRSERDFDEGVFSSGRTAGRDRFVADLEKQMEKATEPLDVSAYGASQYEMFNTSRNNDPQDDFDVEVQDELQSHQDGAELVGHTVKLTDGRRGVVVSGTAPKYELLERGELVRGKRLVRMSAGDITVLVTTDKDGKTLDKFVEQDFDFDLESNSRVIDPTMDWDKEIEESKTDDTVGALVEKNRITDSLLEQVSKSERLSSGGKGSNRSSSKLSSGAQPWSDPDTQKRLIDGARTKNKFKADGKTESYMASMVRQFDAGKKLTDSQWRPLWDNFGGGTSGNDIPKTSLAASTGRDLKPFSGLRRKEIELADVEKYDYPTTDANGKKKPLPTKEQSRAIDAMMTGSDVKISALAATGKTTTVINFAERLKQTDPSARVLYLVFNRNAKDDVAKRGMPDNVNVMTMDGVSYNAMRSINPKMTTKSFDQEPGHIKPLKTFGDRASYLGVKSMVDEGQELSAVDVYKRVSKAVDAFAISNDTEIGEQHFTGAYNGKMAVDNPEIIAQLVPFAEKMWADMNTPRVAPKGSGKGEGMLPMTNTHITKMWALTKPDIGDSEMVNVAMVDEAQDMNPVFAGILKGSNGIQRIYIGDTNQAINAWRGADGKTLNDAYAKYDMPITDSFRFGKEIAGMGNRFLSLLGRNERMTGKKTDKSGLPVDGRIGQIDNPTMILTRSNGGAIAATLDSFKRGLTVFGSKNFKNDLGSFIDNIEYMTTKESGRGYFTDSKGNKIFGKPKESQDLDGISNIREFNKAIEDADNNRLNMLGKIIAENSFEELRVALDKIITDRKNLPKNRDEYVHIQTAHTSKGLESPRVKIWTDFRKPKKDENGNVLMPNEQELRLSYVAVTRAEEELDLGSLGWIAEFTTDEDGEPSKLSSGRDASRILGRSIEKPETEKLITSDREIFERRMGGESLAETATALGIRREEVAQAEKRHMARMRGTLSTLDADDAEAYRQEQYRMAEENAADEALNKYINEQISSGASLDAVAKELSISKEQVRARNNSHIDFLKAEDAAAEEFLSRVSVRRSSGDQGPPRSEMDYVSPLEGMEPGQKLSSGKMDEVYRSVQEKLIEQIEKIQETGDGKWEFPWHKTALPKNVTNNNRPYSGINSMMLMFKQDSMGYKTPLWAGFNQWKKEGGTVRKGEKGTMIMIPTVLPKKKDADGKEIASSGGIFFKTGHVFNIDQIDGIDKDKFKITELPEAERVAELEQALSEVGAIVNHGGDRAFYRPSTDEITLPPFASFKSKEGYYAVFAHELMHWTGHSSRLNRDHLGDFGSPEYAQEELIAEIASAFFMAAHGLTPEPREDHAQYLAGWLKRLKSDPDAMKKAFGEAQKAHDFAISKSPSMSKKLGKKVAEAGAIPGNDDGGYGEITPSLSSGARDRYVRNPEGTIRTLADEMGAFGDELLTRFQMAQGPRDGDRNWFEDYAELGESRSLNQWNISEDEFGNWSAELLRLEFGNGYTEREPGGLISDEFKSPEDAAKWIASYESTRQEWSKKFKQEKDVEKISSMLDEELARREAEYQDYARISRERSDRQQYVRMIADINESRLDWTMDDWADEASDIQMELSRENSRLSSGMRSRYDDKPVAEIGLVSDALKRTDEAGSNARHIASNLLMVPVEKYDFDAIRKNGKAISFDYGGKSRTVYPTGMMTKKGGGVYFIGLDEDSGQYRSFSLHKIDGIIDGADAPYNPTQPGVPQGAPRSSGQRTRNVVSDRVSGDRGLSSGRSPEDIKSDFANRVESNNPIVKAALDEIRNPASNPRATRSRNSMFFPIEQHGDALRGVDELVSAKYEFIRSVLDGKKITPKDNYFPRVGDLFEYMSEDDFDFVDDLSMAINRITEGLVSNEELLEWVNEQTDYLRENISDLGRMHDDPSNRWRTLDFDTAMQLHIDNADGDDAEALDSMLIDANFIEATLKEVDNFYRKSRNEPDVGSLKTQIDGIEDIIGEVDETTTPQDFAAKLSNFYSSTMKKLDQELTDLFKIQGDFEKNGVSLDRYKIDAPDLPEDILTPIGSGPASVANAADGNKLSSGKKTRTQGAKRRPMSDADRQAFADGVRQRAATIPGKRRPGPSKDEFGNDRLSSGQLRFPDSEARNSVGRYLEDKIKIKFGKMSENNDRSPDGKWMLDAKKLEQILKDEDGTPLSMEQSAKFLGVSQAEIEKMFEDGAGISEIDAYEFIDRAFFGGRDPGRSYETLEAIWGFDAAPYWYDQRRGNQLSRAEYEDYKEEGIAMAPQFYPTDFELPDEFVAREVSKSSFPVSALAESLGVESDDELAEAITFEVDGETITPTAIQLKKWKSEGVPTSIIEQLVDNGIIPSAGDVFGEEGVKFDNSIRQFELWKNIADTLARKGKRVKGRELDEVVGATKVQTRLRAFEAGKEGKFSKNTGKALRYTDDEVQKIVDRLNKKYDLSETVESIKSGGSLSSGRRAARRISSSGQDAVEKLSAGRENNGAPENITPRMQNEIIGWAKNAKWSGFAQSVLSQFEANGFLSSSQWTKLLQLRDNSQRRR